MVTFPIFYIGTIGMELFGSHEQGTRLKSQLCLIGILIRDLTTFFATTLFTLRQLSKDDDVEKHQDQRVEIKSAILDLDAMLTHNLTFTEFKNYIENSKPEYMVHLNLYCLIKLYRQNLKQIYVMSNMIKSKCQKEKLVFNPKNTGDPELQLMQIMLGKSMSNILEFIHENQKNLTPFPQIISFETQDLNHGMEISEDNEIIIQQSDESIEVDRTRTGKNKQSIQMDHTVETIVEDNEIFLIIIPELLEQYKYMIHVDYEEEDSTGGIHFCRALSYDPFFMLCKNKLEFVFEKNFKKETIFNQLLLKICETEIRQEFLQKAHLLVKSTGRKNSSNEIRRIKPGSGTLSNGDSSKNRISADSLANVSS